MFLVWFFLTQTYKNKHIETKITQVILGKAASSGDGIFLCMCTKNIVICRVTQQHMHRALKPENILINSDFGMARGINNIVNKKMKLYYQNMLQHIGIEHRK